MREPTSLDDRINYLVEDVDREIRAELLDQLKTLRAAENPIGVVSGMSRLALKLFRLIYRGAGKPWPKGDNLYDVTIRAAAGDVQLKIPGYGILPHAMDSEVHTLRVLSNKVDHASEGFRIGVDEAEVALNCFLSVLRWFYCESGLTPRLPFVYSFGPEVPIVPRPLPPPDVNTPSAIPEFDTPFVGRAGEMEQVRYLLVNEVKGVVTVTGTGGIGKSRFACEVARRLLPHFPGGAYFVELKEHTSVEGICVAVADAFGLKLDQAGDPARVIGDFLRSLRKPTLLVFDNFEHLAALAGRTVRAWRSTARAVQMLVTSRVSLGVSGEQLFPMPSLALPPFNEFNRRDLAALGRNESVTLFCQSAAARGRRFELTLENAWHVMEICRLLQGQPLPIILVAKRVRFRKIQDLVMDLEARPLDAAQADGQALRETIDWSYQLLSGAEQDVFRQVCIFRDGFTSEAAEAVVEVAGGTAVGHVERLCDFSLIEGVPLADGRIRFTLFQTILDFGRGLWPGGHEAPPAGLARRWADYYLGHAEAASALVPTPDCNNALGRLVEERENILGAHRWAVENGLGAPATRLILAYSPALRFSGPWQIRVGLFRETLEALAEGDPRLRVLVRIELSDALWGASDYPEAFAVASEALAIAREGPDPDPALLSEALHEAAKRAEDSGRRQLAMDLHEEGLRISLGRGDERIAALHEAGMGSLLDRFGRYAEARASVRSAVARLERIGDRISLAWAVNRMGLIVWHEGRDEEAVEHFRRAERLFREIDYPRWYAGTMTNQGLALNELERLDEAIACFQDAGVIHEGQGNRAWWAVNQAGLGTSYWLQGDLPRALTILSEALLVSEESGYRENEALLHGLIGRVRVAAGEVEAAEGHFLKAVAIEDQIGSRDRRYFGNLVNLAWVEDALGRAEKVGPLLAGAGEIAGKLGLTETHPIRMVREDAIRARGLQERA